MANTRILKSLDFHLLSAHRGSDNFVNTDSNLAVYTASVPRNSSVTYTVRVGGAAARFAGEDETSSTEKLALEYDDIIASISLPTNVYWYDSARGRLMTGSPIKVCIKLRYLKRFIYTV